MKTIIYLFIFFVNTPAPTSKVHCIIYAKYLFSNLFGVQDDDSSLLSDLLQDINIQEPVEENAIILFDMLFNKDIENKKKDSSKFSEVRTLKFSDCKID